MTLAYSFPLLSVFVSMFWFFLMVVWIMTLFYVFADIFRSHDMNGGAKALWMLFVIVLPILGVFVYLLARGDKMSKHSAEAAEAQDAAFQAYTNRVAGTSGPGDQLAQLASLRDSGAITTTEYDAGKAKVLA
ncbi:MAG: SHOCT domain-containing protein [Acidimicrobiia bacterium]